MTIRRGVSIIEVIVALVVFSVAALGSAGTLTLAMRAQQNAAARRAALGALESEAAALSVQRCAALAAGQSVVQGVSVEWAVALSDSIARVTLRATRRGTQTILQTEAVCE